MRASSVAAHTVTDRRRHRSHCCGWRVQKM